MKHTFTLGGLVFLALAAFSATAKEPKPAANAPGKVLFVLTSHDRKGDTGQPTGFYLGEATHPYHEIAGAGYTVDFVSPKGGKAPVDGFDLNDPINKRYWEDPVFRKGVEHTLKPGEVKAGDYAAIFYAGGHGTMWDFPQNQELAGIAASIYERGGVVGAVCHGPAALVKVRLSNGEPLVKGKDVAAFTNDEEVAVKLEKVIPFFLADALEKQGAKHHPAPNFQPKVVVSERLVTGQNPASAKGVGEEMVKLLKR